MQDQLSKLLVDLSNESLFSEKNILLNDINCLNDDLTDIQNGLKQRMHNAVEADDYDLVTKYKNLRDRIVDLRNILSNFELFHEDKHYDSIDIRKTDLFLERQKEIKLDDDLTYKQPTAIRIGNNTYNLQKNAWTDLLELVCDVLASADREKFLSFAEIFNRRKLKGCCFLHSNVENNKRIYYIKAAGIYLQRANIRALSVSSIILSMLTYFGYENNYGLYIVEAVAINNDEDDYKDASADEGTTLTLNSKIIHKKFGEGTIVSMYDDKLDIHFVNFGRKTFRKQDITTDHFEIK